ncbi:MAG TPA: hypothetical protein PK413_07740, partial [Thermoanaerobaculia bacterium]|nr:hypothetical protein [Thermoanaerobaculia bacterium]
YPVGLGALLSLYLPISKWANTDGFRTFIAEQNINRLDFIKAAIVKLDGRVKPGHEGREIASRPPRNRR